MDWRRCWIGLGGNCGDVAGAFDTALERLDREKLVRLVRESARFGTAAIGSEKGARYLNSVAEVQIACTPLEFLAVLQRLESELGRVRGEYWGERTIDLDLLLDESLVVNHPRLKLPHPHLFYRRFVLDPLVQLAGEIRHPICGMTIQKLLDRLLIRPLGVSVCGGDTALRGKVVQRLRDSFHSEKLNVWDVSCVEEIVGETVLDLWLGKTDENGAVGYEDLPVSCRLDLDLVQLEKTEAAAQVMRAALGE